MAIDGRDIARQRRQADSPDVDAYDHPVAKTVAFMIVAVPLALVVAFAFWAGTWDVAGLHGGVMGGVVSVLLTVGTIGWFWLARRRKSRR